MFLLLSRVHENNDVCQAFVSIISPYVKFFKKIAFITYNTDTVEFFWERTPKEKVSKKDYLIE